MTKYEKLQLLHHKPCSPFDLPSRLFLLFTIIFHFSISLYSIFFPHPSITLRSPFNFRLTPPSVSPFENKRRLCGRRRRVARRTRIEEGRGGEMGREASERLMESACTFTRAFNLHRFLGKKNPVPLPFCLNLYRVLLFRVWQWHETFYLSLLLFAPFNKCSTLKKERKKEKRRVIESTKSEMDPVTLLNFA